MTWPRRCLWLRCFDSWRLQIAITTSTLHVCQLNVAMCCKNLLKVWLEMSSALYLFTKFLSKNVEAVSYSWIIEYTYIRFYQHWKRDCLEFQLILCVFAKHFDVLGFIFACARSVWLDHYSLVILSHVCTTCTHTYLPKLYWKAQDVILVHMFMPMLVQIGYWIELDNYSNSW